MHLDIDAVIRNLLSKDIDVRSLALRTLSRISIEKLKSSDQLMRIEEALLNLNKIEDVELNTITQSLIEKIEQQLKKLDGGSNTDPHISSNTELSGLRHSDPQIRKNSLIQIINRKLNDARDEVIRMLTHEQNDEVLAIAIKTLGRIGNAKTSKLLETFLYFSNPQVRINAIRAISNLSNSEDKLRLLLPVLSFLNDQEMKHLIDSLSEYGSEKIIDYLKDNLSSENHYRKLKTLEILRHLSGKSVSSLFAISALDASESIRLATVKALSDRSDPQALHLIHHLTQDSDIEVSEAAVKLLTKESTDLKLTKLDIELFDIPEPIEAPPQNSPRLPEVATETKADPMDTFPDFESVAQIDEQIDKQFLSFGQTIYSRIKSGTEIHDDLLGSISEVQVALQKLNDFENLRPKKGIVMSLKQAVTGGNIQHKIQIQTSQIALEEAFIELGEQGFQLINNNEWNINEIGPLMERIRYLFQKRKESEVAT